MSPERLLTYHELAERLNLPLGSLYALVSRGRIPHVRIGPRCVRFESAAIEAWLSASRHATATDGGER